MSVGRKGFLTSFSPPLLKINKILLSRVVVENLSIIAKIIIPFLETLPMNYAPVKTERGGGRKSEMFLRKVLLLGWVMWRKGIHHYYCRSCIHMTTYILE